jgi:hypothetical protein
MRLDGGTEDQTGRLVDFGMIVPRLQQLYQWSAHGLVLHKRTTRQSKKCSTDILCITQA